MSSSEGCWIPIESPTGVEAFGIKEMTVTEVRCSACGSEEDVSFTGYEYCPRCGAKMKRRATSMGENDQELTALEKQMQRRIRDQESQAILDGARELLKEQEAVKRTYRTGIDGFSIIWTCGACGSDLYPNNAKAKYCSNCGQAVKWE